MKCFTPQEITLKTPIWSKHDGEFIRKVPVGCGKCAACIQRKIAEWTFRLDNERVNSAVTYFVTLTYDNYHVPINRYGKMTLDKSHVQQLMKKIRYDQKANEEYGIFEMHYFNTDLRKEKIKYYAVGEYGTINKRPHYHLVMYNIPKEAIKQNWEHGEVDIQIPRDSKAMGYVIKYLSKRLNGTTPGNVSKEFSLMSKGIGLAYVEKMKQWHKRNKDVLYTSNETSTKIPMSKYYRNMIFTDEEKEEQIPIIKKNMLDNENEEREKWGDGYERKKDHQRKQFSKKVRSRASQNRRKDL